MRYNRRMSRALAALIVLATSPALATTYPVGAGRSYTTLASLPTLAPGDVVEIDAGTYHEVKRWTDAGSAGAPITIRGVGATRPIIDATGKTVDGVLPNPRAVFQIEAAYVVVENLELVNARNGNNGAGVRVTGAAANHVTLRGLKLDNNDMGVMSDGNDDLVIESCEIASNGTSMFSGYSHNLYLGGNKTTIRFSYIHDSLFGQNVKSRGHYTVLLYNYVANSQDGEIGLVDGADTATPNSNAVLVGNIVVSKPREAGWNNGRFVWFGQDGGGAHTGTLYAVNNTFVAGDGRIYFLDSNAAGAAVVAVNNVFSGSDKIVNSGPSSGSNNWMPTTATVPAGFTATVKGATPGFVNAANRDFHLLASSPARDVALAMPMFADGSGAMQPGAPTLEYVVDLQSAMRLDDGTLDVGAYEFGTAAPVLDLAGGGADDLGGAPDLAGGTHAGKHGCGCTVGGAPSPLSAPLALAAFALAVAAARPRSAARRRRLRR
jgi:parallel beta helix pectate lyase-like protein